jgi:hypothetical protein
MSSSLLSKDALIMFFRSDKFILIKSEIFVEKRYLFYGIFKMNIMTITTKEKMINNNNNNNNNTFYSYLFESCDVWHIRLVQSFLQHINLVKIVNKIYFSRVQSILLDNLWSFKFLTNITWKLTFFLWNQNLVIKFNITRDLLTIYNLVNILKPNPLDKP